MIKILFGSVLFVTLYNLLFYPTVIGIGLGVLFAILNAYLFFVRMKQPGNLHLAVSCSLVSVLFAAAIGWRANGMVQTINLAMALFLTVVAAYFYKYEKVFPWSIIAFLATPLAAVGEGLISSLQFISHRYQATQTKHRNATLVPIGRGVIIAVPILFILFKVLAGADPIFARIYGAPTFSLSPQLIISLVLFTAAFFWGITAVKDRFLLRNIPSEAIPEKASMSIEALMVTLSTAILFGLFLIVQLQYLFLDVPETQLQHLGINMTTYSEYVRQGFFQLLCAAGIATTIIAFSVRNIHFVTNSLKRVMQTSMIVVTLETELLLLSAAKRLSLYTGAHGLTVSRIFGIIFLMWLSAILVVLMYRIVRRVKGIYLFLSWMVITAGALMSVNILPIEAIIGTKYPPTINGQIDYQYIAMLSSDASASWIPVILHAQREWQTLGSVDIPTDEQTRNVASITLTLTRLGRTVDYLDKKYTAIKWQAFIDSEYQAYRLIQANRPLFDQIQILRDEIKKKEQKWSDAQIKRNQRDPIRR